jgi:cation diffusion facilitator CzcD-associated flavoprotein CzcO
MSSIEEYIDVAIIGAGLSGIGAAYHVQNTCPELTYAVYEGRSAMGGTWDLFRYPGIRSDSDMYTFGFSFNPWKSPKAIADGPSILAYIKETAEKFDITPWIRFSHRVERASWSSEENRWILSMTLPEGQKKTVKCRFLISCTGYYNYEKGYEPDFPNRDTFSGPIIHPQHWPEDFDYSGRRVVIIGSGATAVTLVPELAKKAAKVTMLQRSPTYIMNLPREDAAANFFKKVFPPKTAYALSRWKNILLGIGLYGASRKYPDSIRSFLKGRIKKTLGDKYDERHFEPKYNPWDQRLCLVPDNDLFEAIKGGKAEVVTDTIASFTETGIALNSGKILDADVIVTATGLQIQIFGGIQVDIDGEELVTSELHAYRGVMFSGVPNMGVAIGYTNASWTLKCDLSARFLGKVLRYLIDSGKEVVTPHFDAEKYQTERLLDFDAGYILRAEHVLPKQGSKAPWKVHQNYIKDLISLRYSRVDDGHLRYR